MASLGLTVPTNFACANENRFWITGTLQPSPKNFKINLQDRNFNWQGLISQFGALIGGHLDLLLDHEFNFYYYNILHWDTWSSLLWKYPLSYCDPLPLYAGQPFNISILVSASGYQVVYYRDGQSIKTIYHPKTIQPSIIDVMGDFQAGSIKVNHQRCCVNGQHCQFKWGDWEGGDIVTKPPKLAHGHGDSSDDSSHERHGHRHRGDGRHGHGSHSHDSHGGHGHLKNYRSSSGNSRDSRDDSKDSRDPRGPKDKKDLKNSRGSGKNPRKYPIEEENSRDGWSDESGYDDIIINVVNSIS